MKSIQEIFEQVCDLPPSERDRAVAKECGSDSQRRAEVESLLRAHLSAGSFLSRPTADYSYDDEPPQFARVQIHRGDIVGDRFKILQQIGEGGFGVVFMARQVQPVKRTVAIKIIKLGMDTRQVVARFEAERQALAMMNHPNIARVLDAGATKEGRPYFAMELVRGDPITEYCDSRRLPTEERLKLFQQVCDAVQHAHQKGVIHRDIKPTNVLVTIENDAPLVKVIDFGIAKATNSELTERTLFTEFRQLIGTPEYMSPEQAERSGVDVDTRTDIYSLGVLLYEMLTGTTPFERNRICSAAWESFREMLLTEDPPVPSTRLSTRKDQLDEVARDRRLDPRKLHAQLKGELDWIVMKSLAKDRTRRYATTTEFSDDIDRYLSGRPVLAGPPSAIYQATKFVQRHRGWIAAAGAVVLSLVLGTTLSIIAMLWALRERDHAVEAEAKAQRFAAMANILMSPQEMDRDRAAWAEEINAMQVPADDANRVRQECQYVTWLWCRGSIHGVPHFQDEAAAKMEELYGRAQRVLGADDINTVSILNVLIQHKMVQSVPMKDVVPLYRNLLNSVRAIYGDESDLAGELTLEYATILLKSGDPAEARQAFRDYLQANQDKTSYPGTHHIRLEMAMEAIDALPPDQITPELRAVVDLNDKWAVDELDQRDRNSAEGESPGTDVDPPSSGSSPPESKSPPQLHSTRSHDWDWKHVADIESEQIV